MARVIDFTVFDADNHMYETTDAFTKYLPSEYAGLVQYVEVNGRTKIALKGQISEYIPNPTFSVVVLSLPDFKDTACLKPFSQLIFPSHSLSKKLQQFL